MMPAPRYRIAFIWFVVLAFAANALPAAERLPGKSAVASASPLATAAGHEILAKGGNAFDAAVAITAALAVVYPTGSGLAGGGFYLLHRASDGRDVMIDAREKALALASGMAVKLGKLVSVVENAAETQRQPSMLAAAMRMESLPVEAGESAVSVGVTAHFAIKG